MSIFASSMDGSLVIYKDEEVIFHNPTMSARSSVRFASALAYRPRPQTFVARPWQQTHQVQRRCFADKMGTTQDEIHGRLTTHEEGNEPKGPNTDQAPHVSEEAAATSKIMGTEGPDVTQGTPVQDVCFEENQ